MVLNIARKCDEKLKISIIVFKHDGIPYRIYFHYSFVCERGNNRAHYVLFLLIRILLVTVRDRFQFLI